MEIHKILAKLEDFKPEPVAETGLAAYIQTHKMIKPGQESFFYACLYVGYVSELPEKLITDQISNLICINDKPLPQGFLESGDMNLYLLPAGTNQFDVLNRIADIMIDEATLVSAMRRILDALYANTGLQELVDVASEVFENPLFVNDTAFKILAMSHKTKFTDETLEEEKQLGYVYEENVNSMKRDRIMEKCHATDSIVYSERSDKNERWLFKSVKLHDIVVADVGIVDNNRPFREIDYELLERFSKIVAIEMEKNEFYKDNKGVMYSYFLADLLSGKVLNQKAIVQRARILNWKMYDWFQVAVVIDHKNLISEDKIQFVAHEIRSIIADCRWTYWQNNLVLFTSRPSKEIMTKAEREQFYTFLTNSGLSAGISMPFNNPVDTSRYYRQASRAVEAGVYANRGCGVFYYNDVIPYCVAQGLEKRNDLRDYCPESVATVLRYDAENGTELLTTLEQYLLHVDDPVSAARELHIHRNTLLYRINKIRELTEIDLRNGDERLKIQLYLKFLKYQNGGW